jgi:hypothetical protein
MQHFKTRPYIAKANIDPGTASIADQFAELMGQIRLEYDLEPDVWGAAQDVLQALKARRNIGHESSRRQAEGVCSGGPINSHSS